MKKSMIEIAGIRFPLCSLNTLIIGSGAAALNAAVNLFDCGQKNIAIATNALLKMSKTKGYRFLTGMKSSPYSQKKEAEKRMLSEP